MDALPPPKISYKLSTKAYAPARRTKIAKAYSTVNRQFMDEVQSLLVNLVPYSQIEKIMSQKWRKPRPFVRKVIQWVHNEWAFTSTDPEFTKTRKDTIRNAFQNLYTKAASQSEFNVMATVLKELSHLDGLYAPRQVDISGQVASTIGVGIGLAALGYKSADDVRIRLDELKARLKEHGPQALALNAIGKPVIDVEVAIAKEAAVAASKATP